MRTSKEIAAEIKAINANGRKTNRTQNEGAEGYDHTANTSELEAEHHAAKKAEFAAEWTLEVTAERRAAWNKIARTFKSRADRIAAERNQGWTIDDLKKAVALYK